MFQKYSINTSPIYDSLSFISKHDRNEQQWQDLFHDLIDNTYANHVHVFTDGSKKDESVGIGIWSSNFSIKAKLSSHCSIFSAELAVIYLAIKFI